MRYTLVLLGAIAATLLPAILCQQQNRCLDDMRKTLLGCVREAQLSDAEFMHFVTNGTRGTAPADAEAGKQKLCGAQQAVGGCVFQKMAAVVNSTACVGTSPQTNQQAVIQQQLSTIFGTYDMKCMHPCRNTLATELRDCYTDAGLDPTLFLSNATNGAVVGSTKEQVDTFCGAKNALISCMNNRVDNCPEAPQILRVIDLDIPSFEKGVSVLCAHPDVYLHGLKCFSDSTNEVDRCQQKEAQAMLQLDQQARQGNWSEDKFFLQFCEIVTEQIKCDTGAWAKKNHEACVEAVVGLRRELECELIPPQCNINTKQISDLEHACHPEHFKEDERNNFDPSTATKTPAAPGSGGGSAGSSDSHASPGGAAHLVVNLALLIMTSSLAGLAAHSSC